MPIIVQNGQFHLYTANTSYIFAILQNKYLVHLYWGARLRESTNLCEQLLTPVCFRPSGLNTLLSEEKKIYLRDLPLEFSTVGRGDFRTPSLQVRQPDGSETCEYEYEGYRLLDGKPGLAELPCVYAEAEDRTQTLEITLCDPLSQMKICLQYSVLPEYDAICRSVRYENCGDGEIHLLDAASACVDIYGVNGKLLNFHGDWLRERSEEWVPVCHGIQSFDSKRGMSGHMHTPFLALCEEDAGQDHGRVYTMLLLYSGNFRCFAEGTETGTTRIGTGINPFGFDWLLPPGDSFQTPEAVLTFSERGLSWITRQLHRLIRQRICRGPWRDRERPVLINNWEATYFHFNEEKLLQIAEVGARLGAELFVLDDGWFGRRENDRSSLGDWSPNLQKLQHGLDGLSKQIHAMGLQFGLWVEPEMVSPDSELYRAHPDWCIHVPGRQRTEHRNQLVLDVGRAEVRTWLLERLTELFSSTKIEYVKWDCNRNINETASPMQAHRYMLGLYALLKAVTSRFPEILFESCAGGGGRFDAGMLAYMPQTWTSDETNAIGRIPIQYSTARTFPAITMGAHMGGCQTGSSTENAALDMAAYVAMSGNFGAELDLTKLSPAEQKQVSRAIAQYKEIRHDVQFGDLYQLESPYDTDYASCLYVSDARAVLFAYQTRSKANGEERRIRLKGIDPGKNYRCEGKLYAGDALMELGIRIPLSAEAYFGVVMIFTEE